MLRNLDDRAAARKQLEEATGLLGSTTRDESIRTTILHELAQLAKEEGDDDRARSLLEEALARCESGDHEAPGVEMTRAMILSSLGCLALEKGDLPGAEAALERSWEIYRRERGEYHSACATVALNLARVHMDRGKDAEAEQLLRGSLSVRSKIYGPAHDLVADVHLRLGRVLMHLDRDAEATIEAENARAIYQDYLPRSKAKLGATFELLGTLKLKLEDLPAAQRCLERSVDLLSCEDANQMALPTSQLLLATVYRSRGFRKRAHDMMTASLAALDADAGNCNKELRATLLRHWLELAQFRRELNDLDDAIAAFRHAVTLAEASASAKLSLALTGLGNVLRLRGQNEEARDVLLRAAALLEPSSELSPEEKNQTYRLLGEVLLLGLNLPTQARPYFELALSFGEESFTVPKLYSNTLGNLASSLHQSQGDPLLVDKYLQMALASECAQLGPEHPEVAFTLSNMGMIYKTRGDATAAIRALQQAYKILAPLQHPIAKSIKNDLDQLKARRSTGRVRRK